MEKRINICPCCGEQVEGKMEETSARFWAKEAAKQEWKYQAKGIGAISDWIVPGSGDIVETIVKGSKYGIPIGPQADKRKQFIEKRVEEQCPDGRCYFICGSCNSRWIQWYDKNREIIPYEVIDQQRMYWLHMLKDKLNKKQLPAILTTVAAAIALIVFLCSEKMTTVEKSFLFVNYTSEEFTPQAYISMLGFIVFGVAAGFLWYNFSKAKRAYDTIDRMSFEEYIASSYCKF